MCSAEALTGGDLGLDPRLLRPSGHPDQGSFLFVWRFVWLFGFGGLFLSFFFFFSPFPFFLSLPPLVEAAVISNHFARA